MTLQKRSNYHSLHCRGVQRDLEDQDNSEDRKDGGTPLWFWEGQQLLGFVQSMEDDDLRTGTKTLFMWVRCHSKI